MQKQGRVVNQSIPAYAPVLQLVAEEAEAHLRCSIESDRFFEESTPFHVQTQPLTSLVQCSLTWQTCV